MINTNELMRGNYLQYKIDSNYLQYKVDPIKEYKICRVSEIKLIEVCVELVKDNIFKTVFEDDLESIPITEEILEKCGFYKYETSSGNWFVNDFDDKIFQLNGARSDEYELIGVASPFKYLHELQNIYFIYRKEQLEINL